MTFRRLVALLGFLIVVEPDCQALFGDLLQCPEGTACVSTWNGTKCVTRCEGPVLE